MDGAALLTLVGARVDLATRELLDTDPSLAQKFTDACAAIAQRYPSAALDETFASYIAERLLKQAALATALPRLRIEDLFLTWRAQRGDAAAINDFESAHAGLLAQLTSRFHRLPADELRQRLRIRLFVADGAASPRIAEFSGFGFLENWLKVTATRTFIDISRSEKRRLLEDELDDADLFGLATPGEPGMEPYRAQLRTAVKRAFSSAVAALAPRERNFLRNAHVDKLTLDQIAALYSVHRATVARTLAHARAQIIEGTRAAVVGELGIAADQLDSAVRLLDSRFELSLSRVLRSAVATGTPADLDERSS